VLGGNAIFKAIKIKSGIAKNYNEDHTMSAVLAPRRSDGETFLVTRADPGVYYSGRVRPGDREVTLTKFRATEPTSNAPGENDTLALIYAGSYDAHVKILGMPRSAMDAQLATVTQYLMNYRGLHQFDAFMNSHFDMGTTQAQAALFCHFTQMRLNQTTRAAAAVWRKVDQSTAITEREDIALQLNRILSPQQRYTAERLVQPAIVRAMLGKKNLAYLKLQFNTDPATSAVYYSVSGLAGKGVKCKLTEFRQGKDSMDYQGWQREGNAAISIEGTRYVDAQPTRSTLRRRKEPFALPDTSTPAKFVKSSPNPRKGDSENNILEKLKADGIDFETISSATLYTKLPVCPSCTEVLNKLQKLMRNASLHVHEGLS
jgi:hypothetical protein